MLTTNWAKSSKSGPNTDNCVECRYVPPSACTNATNCVEVSTDGRHEGMILIRDTKERHLPDDQRTVMRFTPAEWRAFLAGVRAGEFDLPADQLVTV